MTPPRARSSPRKGAAAKVAGSKKRSAKSNSKKAARQSTAPAQEESPLLFLDHASEDLLASQLLEELEFRHGVEVATLDLKIRDGLAVARGSVSDLEELEAVQEIMQDAGSVTDLSFMVQVAPERRENDRDRARQIQDLLETAPDLASENLSVAVVGPKCILRGTVASRLKKIKAGLLALRLGDVRRVANRLVVLEAF